MTRLPITNISATNEPKTHAESHFQSNGIQVVVPNNQRMIEELWLITRTLHKVGKLKTIWKIW